MPEQLISQPDVARRLAVSAMTIHRWRHDPELAFPMGITIRRRVFFRLTEIEDFYRRQIERSRAA